MDEHTPRKEVLEAQLKVIGEVLLNGCNTVTAQRANEYLFSTGYDGEPHTPEDLPIVAAGGIALIMNTLARQGHQEIVVEAMIALLDSEITAELLARVVSGGSGSLQTMEIPMDSEMGRMIGGMMQDEEADRQAEYYEAGNGN